MRDIRNHVIVGLGLACAFLVGTMVARPGESAFAQQGGASGAYGASTVSSNGRYIAATGSVGSGMSVLWLVDTESRRLVVYGSSAMGKSVELRAARNIEWDLRLDEYNDESQYKADDLERLSRRQKDNKAPKGENSKDDHVPEVEPGDGKGK